MVEIIGLGEIVIDFVSKIPYFPEPDEKIDAISQEKFAGGVTANYVTAASRLGVKTGFMGAVGDDPDGDFLIEDLEKENVDHSFTLKKKNMKTPINFIMVDLNGDKIIIQSPHMQITKLDIGDINENYISNAKLLHTTAIHTEITLKAIEIAKKNDIIVSFDLEKQISIRGWDILKPIIEKTDILCPNKAGAMELTGTTTPQEAAKVLIKKGPKIVVITLGDKGCLIQTEEKQIICPSFKIEDVVDTTGAGDTFNGAFSVGFLKDWSLNEIGEFANAAAALKIQKMGARTGMPTFNQVMKFLNK
ncbi:MAG: carbohydrate kinase family protein [Candidatus Helarchaeota archaeon]